MSKAKRWEGATKDDQYSIMAKDRRLDRNNSGKNIPLHRQKRCILGGFVQYLAKIVAIV